jgi:hypothetical protein
MNERINMPLLLRASTFKVLPNKEWKEFEKIINEQKIDNSKKSESKSQSRK